MINLYEENESNFKHNAYVLNEALKVETEEEINKAFNVNIFYPVNDIKNISGMLVPGAIVKIPTWDKRENQLFVIRRSKPSLDSMNIDVFAQHILTTRLENNVVLDTNIVGKTRKEAVAQVLNNTLNKHNFSAGNKDVNITINNLRIVRYSTLDALIGDKDNTVVNRYGGELEFNNFEVNIVNSSGEDKGINVTYAKNITGATMTLEDTDLITEIVPLGKDGLMLPEKSIKSSNFNSNNPFTRIVEFSNIGVVEAETDSEGNITNADEIVTKEQAYKLLRQACLDKFNKEHVNQVSFNLDLDFVELTDCINFGDNDYSNMDSRVAIGDTINVNIKPFGIVEKGRVYKIKRDAITGKLLGCEVGYKIKSLTDTINSTNNKIDETKEELSKKTNNLKVTMEKRDDEIELSVKNEKDDREASIKLLDGKIEERVTEEDFGAYKRMTAKEISQRVSFGKEFSSEMIQNVDAFRFLFNDASGKKTEITENGITVYDGGFYVKDRHGNMVMWFDNNGVCHIPDAYVDDISVRATSTDSNFYNSLTNLKSVWFNEIGVGNRLNCNSDTFYINRGYDLDEYIDKKCYKMLEDQGLI
ncbi:MULTISPECIES: phage tail spike protein [Clostridium]|uniref:Endopeptidase n=1 Tax=Clostridium botulinum TaxID=1491 RepID=A0A6M0V6Q8_CLOBO|nr:MULTISPECIES: phage tail spike protein [Clostridium]NFE59105.1 endopeptidase [Clostridium botulinum]NFE84538.1 endopeptidase [Clostridium botulinum]NFF88470.1 endopeptidase [Clostridium botulinum]NFG10845.1 endopeptidase [Clostridium botulinum]NFN13975.1 endopeptidase [Clostridium botulinum]